MSDLDGPTRYLLTRTLAAIPNGPEYRQIDRVVREIDGLAKVLIGDETRFYRADQPTPANGGRWPINDLRIGR